MSEALFSVDSITESKELLPQADPAPAASAQRHIPKGDAGEHPAAFKMCSSLFYTTSAEYVL